MTLVSVPIRTFNHEQYIAQALDSVLQQHGANDFSMEIVVGDDGSLDRTREILRHYEARYSGQVRLLLYPNNIGSAANFVETIAACRGEFIALLDGDDYWTDSHKISRQLAYMRANPDCSMVFHQVYLGTLMALARIRFLRV